MALFQVDQVKEGGKEETVTQAHGTERRKNYSGMPGPRGKESDPDGLLIQMKLPSQKGMPIQMKLQNKKGP